MRVPRRTTTLFFLATFLLSSSASLFIYLNHRHTDYHLQLAAGIAVVVMMIMAGGKVIGYQLSLERAIHNLDEAQQLANLGSWERDLVSGAGYWSKNHYRLFGLPPRKIAPSMDEFFELIDPDDRDTARETVLAAVNNGGSYQIRFRLDRDDQKRFFLSRGKVLTDDSGRARTIVGTLQDITEKQRQELLREELLKQKDLFITRLGHDLKTPLTPLVALLPLIRSCAVDQRQQHLIDICGESANLLKELVEKSIQLARLSTFSAIPPKRFDVRLAPLVESSAALLDDSCRLRSIVIENRIPPDIIVKGDAQQLENVLHNLISNALKFSPADSRIIASASTRDGIVTVSFADQGIGLSEEEQHQIFEELYKADPSRHELGSSGLGLSICRRIIELNGGRIRAESPGPGKGTTVSFTLEAGGPI